MHQVLELAHHPEHKEAVVALYHQVWPSRDIAFAERLNRQSLYPGFRGYVLLEDEQLLGFCYGYHSRPGQYYHGLLEAGLGPVSSMRWLNDCFEVVELAIAPEMRRQGFATLLLESVLYGVPHHTAVLTTQVDNVPARSLYVRLGWRVLLEPFYPNTSEPYVIMGKRL
jgi:ribosomal protein S18 acetylase RimI-like enzyme